MTETTTTETDATPEFSTSFLQETLGPDSIEQGDPAPAASTSSEEPMKINIGGEEYTVEEASELLSKGKDYTRKTQEVAAQRKELGVVAEFADTLKANPELAKEVFDFVAAKERGETPAKGASIAIPQGAEIPELTWDDLSEEGKVLMLALQKSSAENAQLKETVKAFGNAVVTIEDAVKGSLSERKAASAAQYAKAELGLEIDPKDLSSLVAAVDAAKGDPVKLLTALAPALKGAADFGQRSSQGKPTSVPTGSSKTFDPDKHTADEVFTLLQRGYTPTS